MTRFLWVAAVLWALLPGAVRGGQTSLRLVYTSGTLGEIRPCG